MGASRCPDCLALEGEAHSADCDYERAFGAGASRNARVFDDEAKTQAWLNFATSYNCLTDARMVTAFTAGWNSCPIGARDEKLQAAVDESSEIFARWMDVLRPFLPDIILTATGTSEMLENLRGYLERLQTDSLDQGLVTACMEESGATYGQIKAILRTYLRGIR